MTWDPEQESTHNEMIARHALADCRAPLVLTIGQTLIAIRCSACQRLVEHYAVFPEDFAAA